MPASQLREESETDREGLHLLCCERRSVQVPAKPHLSSDARIRSNVVAPSGSPISASMLAPLATVPSAAASCGSPTRAVVFDLLGELSSTVNAVEAEPGRRCAVAADCESSSLWTVGRPYLHRALDLQPDGSAAAPAPGLDDGNFGRAVGGIPR